MKKLISLFVLLAGLAFAQFTPAPGLANPALYTSATRTFVALDAGANDTYAVSAAFGTCPTDVAAGELVFFVPNTTNTGPASLNFCTLGALNIKLADGTTDPADGDLTAGRLYELRLKAGAPNTWVLPKPPNPYTSTNCADSAGAAACGSATSGAFVVDAATTSTVVSTTAVTANSLIFVQEDSSLGTRLSVTCNTQSSLTLGAIRVTARTPGTSFTVTLEVGPTTNPMCINFLIVN